MAISMETVMQTVHNYFERSALEGTFRLAGNVLTPAPSAPYVAIRGSAFDGVYSCQNGYLYGLPEGLLEEEWTGMVWELFPPAGFVSLCEEISAFDEKNPAGAMLSESFGDYSYTRGSNARGTAVNWEQAYGSRLNAYRRMFSGVG